jgi:hypothetical protein
MPLWSHLLIKSHTGFLLGLLFRHFYYMLPHALFGSRLYPAREFGIAPHGPWAYVIAVLLYAGVAVFITYLVDSWNRDAEVR